MNNVTIALSVLAATSSVTEAADAIGVPPDTLANMLDHLTARQEAELLGYMAHVESCASV